MSTKRLFISWSREQASTIAPIIKTFCQDVLGLEDIFLSKEIDSGRRWSDEIAEALESCNAGLIIVTAENKTAPWLNFEAGAISKRVADSNVVPLLWNISVGEIADTPLNQFQSKSFSKADLLFVMQNLAKLWGLPAESITRRFEAMWPALDERLAAIPSAETNIEKTINLQDLYGLIQRMSSRLSGIEAALEGFSSDVAAGIFGQSEFATATPQRAAELLNPFFERKDQVRNALAHATRKNTARPRDSDKYDDLIANALGTRAFSPGQRVSHPIFGYGQVSQTGEGVTVMFGDDGEYHEVPTSELR